MNKPLLTSTGIALALVLGGVLFAYQFVKPAPPQTLILATGGAGGAYHDFGQRLQQAFAANGIDLKLKTTAGSAENAQLLAAEEVDIALLQAGTPVAHLDNANNLRGLASLYYEPVWIFHRLKPAPTTLGQLANATINIGPMGSGTAQLANELLALNGLDLGTTGELLHLDHSAATSALLKDNIDVLISVAGVNSEHIQQLLHDPSVALMQLSRADAYHLHKRYLSALRLPAGGIDLAHNVPPESRSLVAVNAMLVARDDLHPALIDLTLLSAPGIVGGPGLFHAAGDFPSAQHLSLPIDAEAERFLSRGPSFLQRYLPFWAATLVDRLIVMIVPLLALLLPLLRLFPPLYRWRVRSRIYRWYEDLTNIEARLDQDTPDATTTIADAIDKLENEVKQVDTPLSYADELYHLRTHIDLVRARLDAS